MQQENKMPGGYLVGDSHANGGIKIQTPEGQIEAEGGEVIVNKRALSLDDEFVCKGTPRDITSKINEMEGGVSWSEQGSCELVKKGPEERRVGDDYAKWGLGMYDKEMANGGTFAKGGYTPIPYNLKITGVYNFKTNDGIEYEVSVAGTERENDTQDSLYFLDSDTTARKDLKNLIINNSIIKKLAKGESVLAISGTGIKGKLKRIKDLYNNGGGVEQAARGKVIVTKISDIPNLQRELNAGRITYRGLGMGKLYDDFYEIANEPGTRIKVEGKEYYITDTDFRKLNWDEKNKKWKNLIRFSAPPRKAALGLNIFRRGDTGEKSKDDADKSEVRDNLRKLDIEYNNLKEEFSKNRAGTDYTIKDYINDKKELIERYRPYIDRAMALGIAVNAGLLYVPSNIQMANGTYMEERKYKIYSKNYPSYPSWTATEQEIIDFIEEETGRKPSDWSDGLNEIGLNYSEVVLTEDMAARGSILRTQDKSKRPSPAVSATIYPAGYRMEGNDGNMWEISVSSNGVHRWVKARAEDGMMTDSKSENSKSVVLEAIDNDDENKTQLWVYYPTYDIPGDVANRFQAEFKVIYVEQRVDSGYYSGYDTVTYIDENAYEYIADSVEDIRITDNDGDDVVLDAETERNIKAEIHKLFEHNIKGEEWESKTNIVLQDVKAANGLIVSSSCGCQHANGGKMENGGGVGKSEIEKLFIEATDKYNETLKNLPDNAENWQIKNDKDRYYSVSMQTGKPVWNDSPDLGYTFRKEVAETLKNKLNELGYDNLVLVQYDPNWWKANGGGIYANGGKLVGKRVRLIEMQDPYAVPKGTMGTIKFVDGISQIHVNWDNGSSLALIPNVDKYKIIHETDLPEDYYQHAIEQDGKLYTGDSYSDISSSERVNFFNVEERTRGYVDKNNNFHALDLDYGTWAYANGGGVGKKLPPIILKKLQEKLTISEKAINKWGGEYYDKVPQLIKDQIDGKTPFTYENYLMVQGDEEKDRYDIFIENNAIELAKKIKKIVDKYKNKEVSDTTVPSAPNSSSFMASVSGKIKLVVNFIQRGGYYSRDKNVLIGVLIGNGIDSVTQKKIKQDIYEVMFPYDQYNSSDGGVMWFTKSGTNYDTVGLMCNTFSFSDSLAEKIINIFNSNTFAKGGGVDSFYIVKSWDLVEDKRKGVKPEIEKYQTRSEAIKAANKRQEMGYSLVEVEDENDNLIYKVSPERAENGKEFWFSPDNRMMKTAQKGTAKQMIENELAKVFGATAMDQVGEDEINYIYELKGNPMMIAATTAMLEEERGLDVETWGKQKRVRIPKRVIDMMTTSLRYPLITPFADGGDLVSGYEAKSKPMVIEDSDSKKKTIREIELKLKDVDIPQAKIGSSQDAYAYFWQIWDKNAINIQEEFAILFLDRQNKVKSYHKLSKGGIASTVVDGALVVGIATKALASGVIVAHNHPSGNTKPSESDIALTKELKNALKLVNINLLDSLIITPTEMSYYSLADEGIVFAKDGYYAGGGSVGYEVTLSASPNPDFDMDSHEATISIPEKRVKVSSLSEARSVVMKFIRDNDLGGGNWTGGEVYKDGQRVATISYNGRVWEGNTSSGIYSEITDLKKKANNGGYVISYGNRKLSRFDRGNIPYSSKWVNGQKIKKAVPEKFFRFSNSSWIVFDSVEDAKSSIDNWITEIQNDDRYGEEIKKPLLKYAENLKNKIVQKYFDGGELAAYGKEIIRSLVGKTIKIVKLQSQIPDLLPVGTEGTIQSIENSGNINVNWDNSLTLPLIPGIDKYEIVFSDEDLSKYMGNKGDSFLIDRANVGEKSIYYLIRATSPHHMIDLFFTTREEAQKFANKKGLIIKNEDFDIAEDGAMIDKIDTDIINIVSSYEIIEEEGYKMIDTDNNNIISNIKSVNKWNNLMFFGDDQGNMYEPAELQGKFVRVGSEVFMVPIADKEISMRNFDINELDSFERMIYNGYIEKGMSKTEALKTLINDYEDFADVEKSSPKLKEIATGFVLPTIEKTEVQKYNGGPYRFKYDLYEVEYEIDENYPIILSVTLDGKEIDIDIFSDEELSDLNERAYQDFIQYNKENLAANGTTITKTYIFTHKNNPRMEIVVKLLPNMKIVDIDNDKGIRFPYSVGQILNMGHKTWACNNNYLVNGVDVCPEKKIFGIRVSDIPQGHPLRHIYPGKFK